MKLVTIRSSQLPAIAKGVKDCVNQGKWMLFTSPTQARLPSTIYFLQTEHALYELDINGEPLHKRAVGEIAPEIDELLHFGDLPQPASLSNGAIPAFSLAPSLLVA